MRKRLSSKLLAVILTVAICATTVLACLMTASAAESCYSFSAPVMSDDHTQVTIDVTFNATEALPDGFAAGAFTLTEVNADGTDYLTVKSVEPVTADVNLINEGDYYMFDAPLSQSVTFKLTLGFSKGVAGEGKTYKVKLTDVELAANDGAYLVQDDANGAVAEITTECNHVIAVVGDPVATGVGGDFGYAVYKNSVCTLCGETFGYQLVPSGKVLDSTESVGTIDLLEFGDYLVNDLGSTSKYYDDKLADNGETGADWDNAIIIDSAEELVYLCKASNLDTEGKYYKVADGIAGFNFATSSLNLDGTLTSPSKAEGKTNMDIVKGSGKNHAGGGADVGFRGHFDGNGATVYGAWTNHEQVSPYAGLFSTAIGNVTIKNIHVKMAHFTATASVGGIVGYHASTDMATLTIENCSVTDSYFEVNGSGWGKGVGAIIGRGASAPAKRETVDNVDYNGDGDTADTIYVNVAYIIKNCYVNLDADNFVTVGGFAPGTVEGQQVCRGGVVGVCDSNALAVSDSVVIGITPYATSISNNNNAVQHSGLETHFTNVYTDQPAGSAVYIGGTLGNRNFTGRVTQVAVKGSAAVVAMPNLDWGTTWIMDGSNTYPRLVKPGETFDTIYWDGTNTKTAPTVGGGTKDNPYIISTVAELAYIFGQLRDNYAITDGKYYKLADGIKSIVMQPYAYGADIKALGSAAATKAYFEANAANMKQWLCYGWEGSTFCGNIDFNGATVYGIYQVSANNAGFISNVDAGAVVSNLTIKNSYMKSMSSGANYQCGAIAAVTNANAYGKSVNGFVWFNNCTVANNYLYGNATSHDRNGVIIGASSDVVYIDNCLVYGNDATYGSGVTMPIWSSAYNGLIVSDSVKVPEGLKVVDDGATTDPRYYNMVRNSIILGAKPYDLAQGIGSRFNDPKCYENVYTDSNVATDKFSSGNSMVVNDQQIKTIKASDALGTAAKNAMPGLTWGTDWFAGNEGEYPAQAPYVTFGVESHSNKDFDIAGANLVYNDDGSISLNIHYIPAYEGFAPTLYVGDTDCTKLFILDTPVASSKRAEIGDNTAMMFTITGLSSRYINTKWHPTLVAPNGAALNWSQSAELSIADVAAATITGNYDAKDKNVAAAVLQYGGAAIGAINTPTNDYTAGTVDLLEFGQYLVDAGSTSQWYDTVLADNGETGADWDNAIIIDSAEEFVYLAKASGDDTIGKYYKVADGIAGFDLSNGKLDYSKGYAANEAVIKGSGKNHSGGTPGFQGHFDGNGITVYGAWTNHNVVSPYAGLFSCTKNTVTIKNVNVKLASFTATTSTGGIIGYHSATEMSTVTVENCSITESYLEAQNSTAYGGGVGYIIGFGASAPALREATDQKDYNGDGDMTDTIYRNVAYNVKNCYVELDEKYVVSPGEDGVTDSGERMCHGGVVAVSGSNAVMVSDCVVVGVKPYATTESTGFNDIQHTGHANNYSNVYTDQPISKATFVGGTTGNTQDLTTVIRSLTKAQITGAAAKTNMPTLDWNTVWTTTSGYPTFISKDYKAPASGLTITWDGSVATGIATGSGTKADPYIIKTVAELAWLVQQKGDVTLDKYYKIADGISTIVLQSADKAADIVSLSSAAETKAYFESGSFTQWKTTGWEQAGFCGNFDGNGATIYGMYATSSNNAALFCTVDAGATIKNIGVKNAYLTSSATNYQVAAIVGVGAGSGYSAKNKGVFAITGCTVANCYMRNKSDSHDRSGVIVGALSEDSYYMENCLVYGNDAYYGANYENKMALVSRAVYNQAAPGTAKLPEGITPTTNGNMYNNEIRNSIILDCDVMFINGGRGWRKNDAGCYTNVYSDMSALVDGVITYPDSTTFTYAETNIKKITADDIVGPDAKAKLPNLNWAEGETGFWHVGAVGDVLGSKEAGALTTSLQTIYDNIELTPDTVGPGVVYNDKGTMDFGVYATSVNLNTNPYISFAFAFNKEYKTNRDKIQIRFTYVLDGANVTTDPITVPAFEGDGTLSYAKDGWYNTPSNGRYHIYRFKDIPVEALGSGIKVEASYDGGAWLDFGTYSVAGLAYEFECSNKLTPSDYYATRIEAAKALLFYTQMLQIRY